MPKGRSQRREGIGAKNRLRLYLGPVKIFFLPLILVINGLVESNVIDAWSDVGRSFAGETAVPQRRRILTDSGIFGKKTAGKQTVNASCSS